MLCHLHPAASAHATCERCQRGLCRACTQQFLQRLCTHCVEAHAQARMRSARRTLWLSVPVFAVSAWSTSLLLRGMLPVRALLFCALLAGVLAFGGWLGLRRWRRTDAHSFTDRVRAVAAGLVFWPWLLIETVRDVRLAGQLRASLPPEARGRSFGLGELGLAVASLACAFTLGAHALGSFTPGSELRAVEAGVAPTAVRSQVAGEQVMPAALPEPAARASSSARLEARREEPAQAERTAEAARAERQRRRARAREEEAEAEAPWPWNEPVARDRTADAPAAGTTSTLTATRTSAPANGSAQANAPASLNGQASAPGLTRLAASESTPENVPAGAQANAPAAANGQASAPGVTRSAASESTPANAPAGTNPSAPMGAATGAPGSAFVPAPGFAPGNADAVRQPIFAAPAGFPARAMRQRRFGAGAMPRQPTFGGGAPASSFAPSSGRAVIAAPPPSYR